MTPTPTPGNALTTDGDSDLANSVHKEAGVSGRLQGHREASLTKPNQIQNK